MLKLVGVRICRLAALWAQAIGGGFARTTLTRRRPIPKFAAAHVVRGEGPMFEWKVFMGGMFVAAAALGSLMAVAVPALALPAVLAGRVGTAVELIGSVAGGVLATLYSKHQR
jgi:predicted lysophospholipase L1 biosynthesis ABC-type transport system permease subunit